MVDDMLQCYVTVACKHNNQQ